MRENLKNEPQIFDTRSAKSKAHFENYKEEPTFENGEPELDEIRQEIAGYYGVPYTTEDDNGKSAETKENHLFFVDNKLISKQRNARAFCVIRRTENGKTDAWYIDGRTGHATLLNRLYNFYGVPDDDKNEKSLGFLDYDGFLNSEAVQKRAKEIGRPINWFLKETSSPSNGKEHIINLTAK